MRSLRIPPFLIKYISNVQSSSQRMLPYWIGAAITAAFSVIYAKVFSWSEELSFSWFHSNPLWAFVITPMALVLSMGLAHLLAPGASGSGIPQLLASLEASHAHLASSNLVLKRLLSLRMIVIKFFASCICVAGGGVTGREGPMLQISAGIFHWIHRIWPRPFAKPNLQPMILAGGAAGLASAFNTPLGGVIFAVEELAKDHISHIRTYVFHSVIIAGILAQALLGNYLYFGQVKVPPSNPREIIPLIMASILIGFAGAGFGSAIVSLLDFRARLRFSLKLAMTLVCGLIVASMAYFYGVQAMGSGRSIIVDLLTHPTSAELLDGLIRCFSNLFTYAGGVVGGIFAPSLSTGAALGSWMSHFVAGANHQLWVLAGMVAFLTGVTRTPFTSLILVLEMTDTHDVILNLMLAAIIAQSAARLIDPISFYEHMSKRLLKSSENEISSKSQ